MATYTNTLTPQAGACYSSMSLGNEVVYAITLAAGQTADIRVIPDRHAATSPRLNGAGRCRAPAAEGSDARGGGAPREPETYNLTPPPLGGVSTAPWKL